jgi:hypothetical protein
MTFTSSWSKKMDDGTTIWAMPDLGAGHLTVPYSKLQAEHLKIPE